MKNKTRKKQETTNDGKKCEKAGKKKKKKKGERVKGRKWSKGRKGVRERG